MKKLLIIFFPFLLIGFIFPDRNPGSNYVVHQDSLIQFDGPYVLYRNDQIFAKYIFENDGTRSARVDSFPLSQKDDLVIQVSTDEPGKTFPVQLKKRLQNEKSVFKKSDRLLVMSDIEGNFAAFKKLLQANGVMDENFNWTFGDGNLVLVGDFFDRGWQVTELLWLIYSLEDKAKAAGGYVHFVLGNHEIMNMSNDFRYLHGKYLESAMLLNEKYQILYGDNSELGRWLRTKNIIEKIGDLLFIHGGISPEINRMDITVTEINDLARPYYADTTYNYPDQKLDTIFGDMGPFWYRGYYMGTKRAGQSEVDSTLDKFNVRRIIHGHTIVRDTISIWFNNRIINTDVHHAVGKSEALLIEGKKFYRVNNKGERFLLPDPVSR